ncbi:hypothetical protein FB554_0443 [Barrientosiimonas humi]|uniref:Alkylation response protein AidB-like acyl-CoA dehydrogenase n=1 Tax=Barrientosiimonas humi TaxID=999931 RepID=A0A542X914_9MICO|nr:acyl-CoA dehydrogenase family protein [Barrientosiimonas humi]TQL32322.1 hypothetical protein FB554_0443 [Barrientosiimonas humi]CAG7572310.1 Acryloyl-CoA reductase (NADH) [Barrientosiimonas humi]
MDFTIDAEQKALRDAVRTLAERHAPQYGDGNAPVGPTDNDEKTWSALAELGALGLPFPEEDGGFGASPVEVSVVASELGRRGVRTAYADALVANYVLTKADSGSDVLEQALSGEALVLPALAEPGRAWSPLETDVTASGTGDEVKLTGTKGPVPSVATATYVVVPASTEGGLGLFLAQVPEGSGPLVQLSDTPATLLVGPDRAADVLTEALCLGIVALAGEALGAMEGALQLTTEYLKTRKQFGVPLMTFQTLTQRAADMYAELELARSTALFAAMVIAENPGDAVTASRTKVVVGQAGRRVGQEAIQLHGGIGMTAEYAVGHLAGRLAEIDRTFGDTRQHLAALASGVSDHEMVDVLA